MKLWACPAGKHPSVRGPERPRLDASCRFCLPCSAGSPTLVPRVQPALERKRARLVDAARDKLAEHVLHCPACGPVDGELKLCGTGRALRAHVTMAKK